MSRRSTILLPSSHDGTSQTQRALPALDPRYVAVDERSSADLLAFVQAYVEQLRYWGVDESGEALREAGTWRDFMRPPTRGDAAKPDADEIANIVAYVREPERFEGELARWLGRPHFALLLTFIELLGHARAQLGELTARHLDYYYGEVLRMQLEPAKPDRAALVIRPASRVDRVRLPAGTALQAGRDVSGVARIYRTERELIVSRAQVAELRSVFVHREITGIPDVRHLRSLTAGGALERALQLALGEPGPGDPIPAWQGQAINQAFFVGLRAPIEFCAAALFLEHHELRVLMQRVRRRGPAADYEWNRINALLGVVNPAKPRDFMANLESRVGKLDFKADGLPQVNGVDDLYTYRAEPDVRAYIDVRFAPLGADYFAKFEEFMRIKMRIDAEWAEINRVLERAGRRQRGVLSWKLEPSDPTNFDANLAKALAGKWPPPSWPWASGSIGGYDTKLRELEAALAMSVERIARVAEFAFELGDEADADAFAWDEIDAILIDAHREHVFAERRAKLAEVRGANDNLLGLDRAANYVVSRPKQGEAAKDLPDPLESWAEVRVKLDEHLDAGSLGVLDYFRAQLSDPNLNRVFAWSDAYRVLELAQRYVEGIPDPVALDVEWRNLHAYADAKSRLDVGPGPVSAAIASPRWMTFGALPPADPQQAPATSLGWALRSPLLSLSQGKRTVTVTLGLRSAGFDRPTFLAGLGILPVEYTDEKLRAELAKAWVVEVSTAKGWVELPLARAKLAGGKPGDDYWSLRGVARALDEDRPALQLELFADESRDGFAPLAKSTLEWPTIRFSLRPRFDEALAEWTTKLEPFEPFVLAAAHVAVSVEGLGGLQLQQDDRRLDPKRPFEPFGARPCVGSRFYVSHPELVRARLDMLRFDLEWMGAPAKLASAYFNYPGISGGPSFKTRVSLVDRNLARSLGDFALFDDDAQQNTQTKRTITIADVPTTLGQNFSYVRRSELTPGADLRAESRYLVWELTPTDFGHGVYPALAASKARELAVGLSKGQVADVAASAAYRVDPPYTPMLKQLSVNYRSSIELDPANPSPVDRLLHVHPFGEAPIVPEDPGLLPRYDQAGELYIGLRDLDAPQQVSLLVQLAEGTSDPDLEPGVISWACLDGDRWHDLGEGQLRFDSTRGLINSGIVELELPRVAPSTRLPGDLYWLRVAVSRNPASVCAAVDILAQAVMAVFEDRGNAPDHYAQPLAVGSIDRLVEPDARVAAIHQPFTSFGGQIAEQPERFRTRVAERLRHKQRALTAWDYERLALQRFGQIYKAKCLVAAGSRELGKVELIVIPDIRGMLPGDALAPKAPANLLADVEAYLRERAPSAATIRVRNAHYVPVLVRIGVRFAPGQDEGFARRRLNDDLVRFLSPWAYEEGADLTIGGRVYASSIVDFVDRRDYVDYVAEIKLFRGRGLDDYELIPPTDADYHVTTEQPDQVLVAAAEHVIDVIPELGYQQASFTGINYMKVELDFIVG